MKIMLVGSSNGKPAFAWAQVQKLQQRLLSLDFVDEVGISDTVFQKGNPSQTMDAEERAKKLMTVFLDKDVSVVLDISGGDACNEVLPYLNWQQLSDCRQFFCGYSDVSVLLNVLADRTQMKIFNFNTMTLLSENGDEQLELLSQALLQPESLASCLSSILDMDDVVRGGNLRCTLKLAGTEFWPILTDCYLLMESMSGRWDRIRSYLVQLEMLGVFEECTAFLVGQFQELEAHGEYDLLLDYLAEKSLQYGVELLPTKWIGHSSSTVPVRYLN